MDKASTKYLFMDIPFVFYSISCFHTLECAALSMQSFWVYKWKRCSKKKCCKQCGQGKFIGTMTKWPVQKHTEHNKTRSIQQTLRNNYFCVFRIFLGFLFSIFNYLKDFSKRSWMHASMKPYHWTSLVVIYFYTVLWE